MVRKYQTILAKFPQYMAWTHNFYLNNKYHMSSSSSSSAASAAYWAFLYSSSSSSDLLNKSYADVLSEISKSPILSIARLSNCLNSLIPLNLCLLIPRKNDLYVGFIGACVITCVLDVQFFTGWPLATHEWSSYPSSFIVRKWDTIWCRVALGRACP